MATKKRPAKRMGRPKVPDDQRLSVKVTIPLTPGDWAEIERAAQRSGVSTTDVIRARIRAGAAS
jgi:hypothetical protein